MMVKADPKAGSGSPELTTAIAKLTEDMTKAGVLLDTGGMQAVVSGTILKLAAGKISATDGPFTEANEVVGGYAIVKVNSKEEAIALARQFLDIHARILGPTCVAETEVLRLYSREEIVLGGEAK
jgi:hypothetical protein